MLLIKSCKSKGRQAGVVKHLILNYLDSSLSLRMTRNYAFEAAFFYLLSLLLEKIFRNPIHLISILQVADFYFSGERCPDIGICFVNFFNGVLYPVETFFQVDVESIIDFYFIHIIGISGIFAGKVQ
jgi:hypothetical protein